MREDNKESTALRWFVIFACAGAIALILIATRTMIYG
jgi:hypothetical protein